MENKQGASMELKSKTTGERIQKRSICALVKALDALKLGEVYETRYELAKDAKVGYRTIGDNRTHKELECRRIVDGSKVHWCSKQTADAWKKERGE